jgi:hypothetical protein
MHLFDRFSFGKEEKMIAKMGLRSFQSTWHKKSVYKAKGFLWANTVCIIDLHVHANNAHKNALF